MINKEVVQSFASKENIALKQAKLLYDELELFFYEVVRANKPLFPKEELDEAWHHLILHTKYYSNYCKETFGRFIHHNPMKTPKGFASCSGSCSAE